jgi:hypothetical protein
MAIRIPLYYDDTSSSSTPILKEMSSGQINEIKNAFKQLYFQSPSVQLTVVGSSGNLGTLYDSRLVAGAVSTGTAAFPGEEVTQEPQITQVGLSRINQVVNTVAVPPNTNNIEYPIYYAVSGSGMPELRSMNLQDMYDTFVADDNSQTYYTLIANEIYTVSTSTTVAGYTEVSGSGTPIFTDTRANPAGYSTIPASEDSTTTTEVTSYYLHKKDYVTPAYQAPARLTSQGNIITPDTATWNSVFQNIIRYIAANVNGYRLRYEINGLGTTCGTVMTDTRLEGSGNYQTFLGGDDDYRAQEFPDGSSVTINEYELTVQQI